MDRPLLRRHAWWLVPLLLADVLMVGAWFGCQREHRSSEPALPAPEPASAMPPVLPDLARLTYPTRQTRLTDTNLVGVYQPTASGNPESGTYGSVRMGNVGKLLLPRFHEGLDIAALARDRQGRPLDDVYAAANGTVSFVNQSAGNSDYGKYIVLTHQDPVGPVYTLYAHLAEVDPAARVGAVVNAGDRLGRMGNTALAPIPMPRAHLHFEIGLLYNSRFLTWPGRRKPFTPGGLYNGQNLAGLNPILVYRDREASERFSLLDHMARLPVAFELLAATTRRPDYFDRHPLLWKGEAFAGRGVVLSVAEGGTPLSGRNPTAEELALLGAAPYRVLRADGAVLGRNGRRHVVSRRGEWVVGENGKTWLNLLLHH